MDGKSEVHGYLVNEDIGLFIEDVSKGVKV